MDLNSLKVFRDVVSAGGYSAAHRETGQSRATLSRHITDLEETLSSRLIERSTRSFRLTEQGQILYDRCIEIFAQVDDALVMVEHLQHEPNGLVRIAIPPSLLHFHLLGEEILRYMEMYPKVNIHIEASNRAVDVHNENVDFVIRARTNLDYPLDYVPVLLAKMNLLLVAHPKWKDQLHGSLDEILGQVPVVAWKSNGEYAYWQLIHKITGQSMQYKTQPKLIVDDMDMMREAILKGLGIAVIPEVYVYEDLALGRLIQLDVEAEPAQSLIHAVHLGQRGMRPAVRHLLDWLKQATENLR